jgi:hypothetical protein
MATMAVSFIGSDNWNIDVHGTISFAARLSGAIKSRRATIQLAFCTSRLNSKLDDFFHTIHERMEARQDGRLPAPDAPVDPEAVQNAINALNVLHGVLDSICVSTRKAGLLNNSFTAGGLLRLRRNDERVIELRAWLEDMLHPEELESLFAKAEQEFERGEIVTLTD